MTLKNIYIGTSGWSYNDWEGKFYPEKIDASQKLIFYSGAFNTVEVNSSFYRLPFKSLISSWNKRLNDDFHFVLKGSRVITHLKKLSNIDDDLKRFLERVLQLKNLKVILWQLPPSFKKELSKLENFLKILPGSVKHAIEFRNLSWWDKDVVSVLKCYNVSFVAVSHPKLPDDIIITSDFLYIRFHGLGNELYKWNYSDEEMLLWVNKLIPYIGKITIYAFFNNDYKAYSTENAKRFRELLITNLISQ